MQERRKKKAENGSSTRYQQDGKTKLKRLDKIQHNNYAIMMIVPFVYYM